MDKIVLPNGQEFKLVADGVLKRGKKRVFSLAEDDGYGLNEIEEIFSNPINTQNISIQNSEGYEIENLEGYNQLLSIGKVFNDVVRVIFEDVGDVANPIGKRRDIYGNYYEVILSKEA